MTKSVRTIYIELRASADKLRADIDNAARKLDDLGKAGSDAGNRIASGMKTAVEAALALERAISLGSRAASAADTLVNSYRALRLALSPTLFTATTVAMGVLVEETIRLTNARGKLIEQQSLLAATTGRSIRSVERIAGYAKVSGGDEGVLQTLRGLTDEDLGTVANRLSSIEDPVKRAAEAMRMFGKEHAGEALEQLTAKFSDAANASYKFGDTLNEVSRTQIFQFHEDLLSLKRTFTEWPAELSAIGEAVKTRLAEMGGAADDLGKRGFKALDDWMARMTLLRGLALPVETLSKDELASQRRASQGPIVSQNLLAQEVGARARESATLEGQRKVQGEVNKQLEELYKALTDGTKLSDADRLYRSAQLQSLRQRYVALGINIKAMEAAEEAEKKAAAKAQELADWQAKAGERLRELQATATQRTLQTPIAQEMFRGRAEVLRDADRTTPAERAGRAAIVTGSLQTVVSEELKKLADAQVKEIEAAEQRMQHLFEFQLSRGIARDEAAVAAMRSMSSRFTGHDVTMAQIAERPGEEVQTAQKILDIKLKAVEAQRVANLTEAQTLALDAERQAALLDYDEAIAAHHKEIERSAVAAGGAYQEQQRALKEQLEVLNQITVTEKNRTDIIQARRALEDQILHSQQQQALASGGLRDGLHAFFLEMEEQAKKPGVILFEGLNTAIDSLSKSLANLATSGHGNFGAALKSIGQQMSEQGIRSIMQQGLGAIGRRLWPGGPGGDKQRDGQSEKTALWTVQGTMTPGTVGGSPGGYLGAVLGDIFSGQSKKNPLIFNMNGGGSVAAGASTPGGVNYYISVDARGADENVIYQRVAAGVMAAHNAAVGNSVQATYERQQRIPQ